MSSERETIMTILSESERACLECSNRACEANLDCWKLCKATADLCNLSNRWISAGIPLTPDLLQLTTRLMTDNIRMCEKHNNSICQSCAQSQRRCLERLQQLQSKPNWWQPKTEMRREGVQQGMQQTTQATRV